MKNRYQYPVILLLLGGALAMAGCSSMKGDDTAYQSSRATQNLEVPPDLELPEMNKEYRIPGIASQQTSYSAYSGGVETASGIVRPGTAPDARLVREDRLVWLEIKSPRDQVWGQLQLFLRDAGFQVVTEDKLVGIMETNWIENKTGVRSGWLSSAAMLDKYRIRLEQSPKPNTTLVFIRHRGLREVYHNEYGDESATTNWELRPADPELEAEMLQRFLVFRGLDKKQLAGITEVQPVQNTTRMTRDSRGQVVLEVDENFPRTWRRVGLALDRMGLVIEDRNRSAGVYYIRLPDNFDSDNDKSWFAGLLGDKKGAAMRKDYLLSIDGNDDKTVVVIRARGQETVDAKVAEKILSQVQNHIS